MGNVVQKDLLKEKIAQLKAGEISHQDFFRDIVEILAKIEATDADLKGVIPFLVSALNNLIKNIEEAQ
ncbi:MAG: hypothetical protein ABGW77_05980 [Campylobacterales bacterium]|jgi:hypothetical protein